MAFAIFDINILYNHVEKSRLLFFNKILSSKHAAPPIFDFLKQSVSCGIYNSKNRINIKDHLFFYKKKSRYTIISKFLQIIQQYFQNLKSNNEATESFKDYETAIERKSWVRKGAARVMFASSGSGSKWENCSLELEQTGTQGGEVEFGTLSIFGTKDKNKEHLSLSEITGICRSGISDKTLAIHTPARTFLLMPLLIKFNGDLEMEEWQADITAGRTTTFVSKSLYSRVLSPRNREKGL